MSMIESIILAIIEGVTEFLPVSSTGHLIIASSLMGINEDPFTKAYTVIVQFGAILSVLVLYWRYFLTSWSFYKKLFIAFLPAAVLGLLVADKIDAILGSVEVVAYSLILGGIALILFERYTKLHDGKEVGEIKNSSAFKIGFYQCLAFIPGVSRSAASIIGGLFEGLNRKAAAEFSFFLGVPTLTGACFVKLLKSRDVITADNIGLLLMGTFVAFIAATLAIKSFIQFLNRHGFTIFGIYRIIVGVVLLVVLAVTKH
ncbi:MAG: undecaprenyl-diphosphate phosphatase [Bdellovibrionales bacterium]|nr:undecaprenyl-diphosphate phosphatase [Bdellovibrionales bacterium]